MSEWGLYLRPDSPFFEEPRFTVLEAERFCLDRADLPSGWHRTRAVDRPWTSIHGPKPLADQGWKIHVATVPAEADAVLSTVAAVCLEHETSFKYLPTSGILRSMSRKYAPRSSSGKFITIYPADITDFDRIAERLEPLLAGGAGAVALTDVQLGTAPLGARYGAFREQRLGLPDGQDTLALRAPDGTLVADRRGPGFTAAEGIPCHVPSGRPSTDAPHRPAAGTCPTGSPVPCTCPMAAGSTRPSPRTAAGWPSRRGAGIRAMDSMAGTRPSPWPMRPAPFVPWPECRGCRT